MIEKAKNDMQNKINELKQLILSGKFGTKNRAELLLRVESLQPRNEVIDEFVNWLYRNDSITQGIFFSKSDIKRYAKDFLALKTNESLSSEQEKI